ncbi:MULTISPECIES: FecR family protein [unclassified Pedobacter]|uniref:FecR family protein n=1 Tax=unclassified Pedobacter TaxID=2628915 RepID=UPI00141F8435|nr:MULTISPECIES: FecR domain-containing protein [unclassified Pedobacter]NII84977.1 ferric-dicitrate binding protein FerR (iron transport regulator) [Pedobacter sp. SG908]NMN38116.1 ferric-dicitrate binding protein FerR (iron transport regulator) [Pedobacter sp. SG918]
MQIDQNLIDKFFAGKCSKEEAIAVSRFLKAPVNFNTYMDEVEKEEMESAPQIDNRISEQMMERILDRIFDRQNRRDTRIRVFSYAAAVLLIVSTVILYQYTSQQTRNQSFGNISLKMQKTPIVLKNKSSRTEKYDLPDGSIVEIEPYSEISYLPFIGNKRDIFLKGAALFRVHKDKKRPFTVYASNLATTALGTIFRISAHHRSRFIKVKLIEGKVVIKPDNKLLAARVTTVYLTPGQCFSLNKKNYATKVSEFVQKDPIKIADPVVSGDGATITSDAIVFNNQSLVTVFNVLSKELNIKIDYQKNSIRKKVFSGKYEFGRDDPAGFLNMICALNNLTVSKTTMGYTIKYELINRKPAIKLKLND